MYAIVEAKVLPFFLILPTKRQNLMSENMVNLVLRNFFKFTFTLGILSVFFYLLLPFMVAIILGGILAMALIPFVDFFMRRGLKRNTSLLLFSFLLSVAALIPTIAFIIRGSRIVSEQLHESNFSQFTDKLINSSYGIIDKFSKLYSLDTIMIRAKVNQLIIVIGSYVSDTFNNWLSELPNIIMMALITIASMYCFLRESEKIRNLFNRYFNFNLTNGNKFIQMFKVCCREVFFANIITGLLQALMVSLGALYFDVGDFFLIFFMTFVFSFVPIIGAAPMAALLGLVCFMDGRIGPGIGMMIIAGFSGVADNLIKPLLGSLGEVEIHPFISLLAVIGGVIMFGLPGLFIGPLIASITFGALPIIIDEYFPSTTTP
jgi:predicted PurR-regulated permease PerM